MAMERVAFWAEEDREEDLMCFYDLMTRPLHGTNVVTSEALGV